MRCCHLLICAGLLLVGGGDALAEPVAHGKKALAWPEVTKECRPWCYNLWLGSAVDKENLARELHRYRAAGLGGIHIVPLYGAKGCENRYIDYLSPKWMNMLAFAIAEGRREGLGVDMTTGTGWCFGGPNVPAEHGGRALVIRKLPLPLAGKLEGPPGTRWEALVLDGPGGRRLDVTGKLLPDGRLVGEPRGPGWTLYALGSRPTNLMVKRAAPGGQGLMLNPFQAAAMQHYLERFSRAFAAPPALRPRAMYHDSYEYFDCQWSPDLLSEFARRRGYRLQDQLEAFAGAGPPDTVARVKCDYRETVSDMMVENVFPQWTAWCRQRGILTRYQAHGSPANWLDLYALADIPEPEFFGRGGPNPLVSRFDADIARSAPGHGREALISKFASSAAHVAGRKLVSSETGTWMAENFCETLEEMKCLVDLFFVSGVNHVFYTSCTYSPDDAPWPGWVFYAATQMNPRNPIWHDVPTLNAYIARCQSVLQAGRPDNDILLYWPIHDFWHQSQGMLPQLTVHEQDWFQRQPIGATAHRLWDRGYTFDYVSDRQLAGAKACDGRMVVPGGTYRAVVVPPVKHMPPETLKKLADLARAGATIIFQDRLPADVPGLGDLERRRSLLTIEVQILKILAAPRGPETSAPTYPGMTEPVPAKPTEVWGRVLVGDPEGALAKAGVARETLTEHPGLRFIRRACQGGRHYFVANQGEKPIDGWVSLACAAKSVAIMDPMTGRTGLAEIRKGGHDTSVHLQLPPGGSIILRTFDTAPVQGDRWKYRQPAGEPVPLAGTWQVKFIEGGPVLPKAFTTTKLASWTRSGNAEAERFAGTAVYRLSFDAPGPGQRWLLDLGRVCHSARVRLNDRPLGTLIMAPYRIVLEGVKPEGNVLEVEVTNLPANRIRDLDRRKVPWKQFQDIAVVNIAYKPFDASGWPVFDSGLLGPVTLQAARENASQTPAPKEPLPKPERPHPIDDRIAVQTDLGELGNMPAQGH